MSKQLSWLELSAVKEGTRVVFVDSHDIYPYCVVPEGTTGIITEQGLNEIWCILSVLPDNDTIRAELKEWDGNIQFSPRNDDSWDLPSPLALA